MPKKPHPPLLFEDLTNRVLYEFSKPVKYSYYSVQNRDEKVTVTIPVGTLLKYHTYYRNGMKYIIEFLFIHPLLDRHNFSVISINDYKREIPYLKVCDNSINTAHDFGLV